jgi:hypothetical protein
MNVNCVSNEGVLLTVNEKRNILRTVKKKEGYLEGHILHRNCPLNTLLKERQRKDRSDRKTRKKRYTDTE